MDIQHVEDVQGEEYLTTLSAVLASLKDNINTSLSELVEKEKNVLANKHRRKEMSGSSDSGMM